MLPYQGALLAEVYDACSDQGESAALFDFFGLPATIREHYRGSPEDLIVQQIMNLFDTGAANPLGNIVQDLSQEPFTQDKLYFWGVRNRPSGRRLS